MEDDRTTDHDDALVVMPLVVLSQTFPARPSAIPDIREFVRRYLAESPLSGEDTRELQRAVANALLDAASAVPASIQVSFRIFPDAVEIDVLRTPASPNAELPVPQQARGEPGRPSFSSWMAAMLKREGLSQEAAARQLGVSVKTVSRWVGGETRPRQRERQKLHDVFGEAPVP